ncbi:type IX secretion system protein PorQ [Soonwooa sp.]|uniref:type IX secretion system protein PorQ n=1 Tax=Soonwooa sp. TaxID=1938592 RepID=UPI00260FC442|nr:type IX secretion system protein PorQ [Soonwooa sp.]
MQIREAILKKISILSLAICSSLVYAQLGTNVYPFLDIPVSPRQSALGGDAVSIRDYDVNMTAANPSLMNIEMDNMVSVNYASYLADSKIGTISYVKDLEQGHLISINARYMDYGKMPRTDESANILGEFSAMDASIGAGYAYQLEDDWTIGGNVNFVTSKIDNYSSMAVSANAGVTYHNERNKETLSLVARNFGYQFKPFNGVREDLPFRIDLGYTKILEQFPAAITVTLHDLQKFDISQETNINGQPVNFGRKVMDHLSFGVELFPEQAFNIRFGYNVKRGNEMAVLDQRNFSGVSAGFGVKISYFKFDYSHARYHNASNVNMFGLSIDLIELSGNRR